MGKHKADLMRYSPVVMQKEEVEAVEMWSKEQIMENVKKGVKITPDSVAGFDLIVNDLSDI